METKLRLKCAYCGESLPVTKTEFYGDVFFEVEPCRGCLDGGYDEGYRDGQRDNEGAW